MVAPLNKQASRQEVIALLQETQKLTSLASRVTPQDRLTFQVSKVKLLRRIARHPVPLDALEAVEVAIWAEEEADRLQEMRAEAEDT